MSETESNREFPIAVVASGILLAGGLVLALAFYFGMFDMPIQADLPIYEARIVDKVVVNGYTRCVVELENGNRYIVIAHTCIEPIDTALSVTKFSNTWRLDDDEMALAK